MQTHDIVIESAVKRSFRVDSLVSVYDCPIDDKQRLQWSCELPDESDQWQIGLIVGPSGSGKTTLAREAYGLTHVEFEPNTPIIDCILPEEEMLTAASLLGAVGLNVIPSWVRPYHVLSNGEQFRASIAKALTLEAPVVCIDEFTSVVDRSVAKVACNAVQKQVRKGSKRLVAVSCHYDIIDWLQPDWIFDMATNEFQWRSLRRRPPIEAEIRHYKSSEVWNTFGKYHYMNNTLHRSAQCYCVVVDDHPVAIAGMIYQPHTGNGSTIWSCSRLVTLPDWQGLGIAMQLIDWVGEYYAARGERVHTHPAHSSLIGSFARSPRWKQIKKSGTYTKKSKTKGVATQGGRPCATFVYCPLSVY